MSRSKNHEEAPISAAFVKELRAVFGEDEVKVVYVKEGEVELGEERK